MLTPDVETLWYRYAAYIAGREPLPGMAYFCYSVLRANAGSNRLAAHRYAIEEKLLTKLRELSSERGDNLTVRKVTTLECP